MNGTKLRMLGVIAILVVLVVCMAACAPKTKSPESDNPQNEKSMEVDFTWSGEADCATCHKKEEASLTDMTCLMAQHSDVSCASCHTDQDALSKVHNKSTPEKAARAVLKATSIQVESCESCHAPSDIAAATAGATVLTDKNGVVSNPHALPESADHESVSCMNCHQMHVSETNLEKKAQRACASCHHAEVYECYTCHN